MWLAHRGRRLLCNIALFLSASSNRLWSFSSIRLALPTQPRAIHSRENLGVSAARCQVLLSLWAQKIVHTFSLPLKNETTSISGVPTLSELFSFVKIWHFSPVVAGVRTPAPQRPATFMSKLITETETSNWQTETVGVLIFCKLYYSSVFREKAKYSSVNLAFRRRFLYTDGRRGGRVRLSEPTYMKLLYVEPVSTWMGDRLQAGIPSRYVTKPARSTQPCIPPGSLNRVPALIGCGKGVNVTSAGWQVTLCDHIRHVTSRSGEAVRELL